MLIALNPPLRPSYFVFLWLQPSRASSEPAVLVAAAPIALACLGTLSVALVISFTPALCFLRYALSVSSWRSLCRTPRYSYFARRSLPSLRRAVSSAPSPFAPERFPEVSLWPPRHLVLARSPSNPLWHLLPRHLSQLSSAAAIASARSCSTRSRSRRTLCLRCAFAFEDYTLAFVLRFRAPVVLSFSSRALALQPCFALRLRFQVAIRAQVALSNIRVACSRFLVLLMPLSTHSLSWLSPFAQSPGLHFATRVGLTSLTHSKHQVESSLCDVALTSDEVKLTGNIRPNHTCAQRAA